MLAVLVMGLFLLLAIFIPRSPKAIFLAVLPMAFCCLLAVFVIGDDYA